MDANTTDDITLSPTDAYFFEIETKLWRYLGTSLIILGTIGHVLTLLVILTNRVNRVLSSAVYISALSLAGMASLYIGLLRFVVFANSDWTINVKVLSNESCKIHTALSYLSLQYVAWLQATIAIDRVLAVTKPHWYKTACGWRKGLLVALTELVLCVLLHVGVLFNVEINEESGYCVSIDDNWYKIWSYIDFLSFSVIPAIIIISCNTVIAIRITRNRTAAQLGSAKRGLSVTSMLISVNVVFLLTTIPISVIYFINWPREIHYKLSLLYCTFSLLQYCGIASTFLVYCLSGSKFRLQLKRMPSDLRSILRSSKKMEEINLAHRNSNHESRRNADTMTALTCDQNSKSLDSSNTE